MIDLFTVGATVGYLIVGFIVGIVSVLFSSTVSPGRDHVLLGLVVVFWPLALALYMITIVAMAIGMTVHRLAQLLQATFRRAPAQSQNENA